MSKTAAVICRNYDPLELDTAIERLFKICGFDSVDFKGAKVLIKPNLLMKRRPEDATTTHPQVVAAVARAVKRRGASKIVLADSMGGPYTADALKGIYKATGMSEVARQEGIELNFDIGHGELHVPQGLMCKKFNIINPVLDADVVINISKLKTHAMTGFTASIKNLFGCIPGLMKPEFHFRFPKKTDFIHMLIDLCQGINPAVSIVDGIVGMEGNGPSSGKVRRCNVLLASQNPFALDLLVSKIINFEQAAMVQPILDRGLCSFEDLNYEGDSLSKLIMSDFEKPVSSEIGFTRYIPKIFRRPVLALLTSRPFVIKKSCIGCAKCAQSCSAKAIKIEKGKAEIDYDKCFRCFCCHEMCPVRSIDIKRFRIFNL